MTVAFHGFRLETLPDDTVMAGELARTGDWAPYEFAVLLPWLRPGDVAWDVGANIGCHTLRFAQAVGPAGTVVAVEPAPRNLEVLRRNVAANGLAQVRVVEAAASDAEGPLELHLSGANAGAHSLQRGSVPDAAGAVRVAGVRLADEARRQGLGPARLVKMDLQGGEPAALRGAREWLARDRPVVFIEYVGAMVEAAGEDRVAFLEQAAPEDYRLFWVDEWTQRTRRTDPARMACLPRHYETNVLMVPAELEWVGPAEWGP